MLTIGICDDEIQQVNKFKELIRSFPSREYLFEINTYTSSAEILADYEEKQFDIVFLDIEIDERSGIDIAKKLKEWNEEIIIIFVSNYTQYVFHAFRLEAFQFLLKPIDEKLFYEELERCLSRYSFGKNKYTIKYKGDVTVLNTKDIVCLESQGKKLVITDKGLNVYETYGRIAEEEERLKKAGFIRCHHGYLVNLDYVKVIEPNSVVTTLTERNKPFEVPLSTRKRKFVLDELNRYIVEQCR